MEYTSITKQKGYLFIIKQTTFRTANPPSLYHQPVAEGNRQVKRNIDHYNLDMIIALGYRIQSQVATRFRRWATQRLHEYIQKGFAMDDERLKQGGNRF